MKPFFKKTKFFVVLVLALCFSSPVYADDWITDIVHFITSTTSAITTVIDDIGSLSTDITTFVTHDLINIITVIANYPTRFANYYAELERVRTEMFTYATTTTQVEHNIEITKTQQDIQQKMTALGNSGNAILQGTSSYSFSLGNTDCSTGTPLFKGLPKGFDNTTDFYQELREYSIHVNINPVSCATSSNSGAQTYDSISANNDCLQQQSNLATFIPQAAKDYTDNEIVCFPVASSFIATTYQSYRQLSQNILLLINQSQAVIQKAAGMPQKTSSQQAAAQKVLNTAILQSQIGMNLASTIFMITNVTDSILDEMETLALGAISIVNNVQHIVINFTSMITQSQNILSGNKKSPQ